jgi:hypothetical protein
MTGDFYDSVFGLFEWISALMLGLDGKFPLSFIPPYARLFHHGYAFLIWIIYAYYIIKCLDENHSNGYFFRILAGFQGIFLSKYTADT